ncbi:MAG: hypothetical protein ACREFO_01015 [Acetobacteraceae bacterium]
MPDQDWGPTIAGLTARAAAAEVLLAYMLAELAKHEANPGRALARIFENVNALLDESHGDPKPAAQLVEMTRGRVSQVVTTAVRIAAGSPTASETPE